MKAILLHRRGEHYKHAIVGEKYRPPEICIFFPQRKEDEDLIGEAEFYEFISFSREVSKELIEGNETKICSVPFGRYKVLHKDVYVSPPKPEPPRWVDVYNPFRKWLHAYKYKTYYEEISTYLLRGESFAKWCEFEAWWKPGASRESSRW